jgi:hypothetical protein
MGKIWLALAALAVEGSVLMWMVGSHGLDWAAALLVGR